MVITLGTKVFDNQRNSYILDEILGSGGFGNVYKAHCENDGTIVAIKMIDNIFDNDDAFLSFQKETNLVKLIASENIIKYLYVHDGNEFIEYPPYIIMEYTNGGTLRDLINNQKGVHFDIEILKSIYLQLARGMKCVSECLVHRDIKPENVFCKPFLQKVAKRFCRSLHLHFVGDCRRHCRPDATGRTPSQTLLTVTA